MWISTQSGEKIWLKLRTYADKKHLSVEFMFQFEGHGIKINMNKPNSKPTQVPPEPSRVDSFRGCILIGLIRWHLDCTGFIILSLVIIFN